jgi:hypothetical protein
MSIANTNLTRVSNYNKHAAHHPEVLVVDGEQVLDELRVVVALLVLLVLRVLVAGLALLDLLRACGGVREGGTKQGSASREQHSERRGPAREEMSCRAVIAEQCTAGMQFGATAGCECNVATQPQEGCCSATTQQTR